MIIVRGKESGKNDLRVIDDGEGIPRDENGIPDFKYVATHIGDSIKRQIRARDVTGIQGELGIGLLSFGIIGSVLNLNFARTSALECFCCSQHCVQAIFCTIVPSSAKADPPGRKPNWL